MDTNVAGPRRRLLVAALAASSLSALIVACGGHLATRPLSPSPAAPRLFTAHAGDRLSGPKVSGSSGLPAVLRATLAATDKEALLQLFDDINKWNTTAQEDLVMSGRVFAVDDGTAVRVLSRHETAEPLRVMGREYDRRLLRVRILEGEYTGEIVWVPLEWVEESPP